MNTILIVSLIIFVFTIPLVSLDTWNRVLTVSNDETMKLWQQRLLALCGLGLFGMLVVHEGAKKTPFSERMYAQYTQPFVDADAYGVVTKVQHTDSDLENVVYLTKGGQEFYYFDLNENWEKRYRIGRNIPIQIGDTISKIRGEKFYSLIKRNGEVSTYTIR